MNQPLRTGLASEQTLFSEEVHLTDYLNIIKKRKWTVAAFFLAIVSIVAIWSFLTTPVYKATTQIMIESQSSFINKIADATYVDPKDDAYYQTQYRLLKSRSLAKKVIEDLGLWKDFKKDDNENPQTPLSSEVTIDPRMVDSYLLSLQVAPIRATKLVDVSFLSKSPEMSARIANAHARAFIAQSTQLQHLVSKQALDWLKTQIKDQKIRMGTSLRTMYEYKYEQLGSFSVDDESIFSLPEIKESPVINDLHTKLAELKARRSEMATKYGPKHPKMIEINSSIQKLEQGITDEVQTIRKAIKTELDKIIAIEDAVQQSGKAPPAEDVPPAQTTITYDMVRLEEESDQGIYDVLLRHAKEIGLTGNMEKNNIRIVDEAEVPRNPAKPRIFLNILLSVVLGFVFGTGFAFFQDYMDRTVRTPEDVTRRLGLSLLGMLPYYKSWKNNEQLALSWGESLPAQDKRAGYPARYDISGSLITRLPMVQSGMSGHILMVESATAGEGKTTILARSAIRLAKGGLRVVMVDADLQKPSLHHLFGLQNGKERGLTNALDGVLSHEIGEGSLSSCSISDLFSLISLKKQSGQLVITNDVKSMTAVFDNGRLFHIQSKDFPIENRLGTMLLRGGFIAEDQLKDALERNQRTGQPLGYILINAGYINQAQLQGPLKLQMEEHLQKLFSWKYGTFTFEPGRVETYEDKRIYFGEDYTAIINRLSRMAGSKLLEKEVLSYVRSVHDQNLSLLPAGTGHPRFDSLVYFKILAKFFEILKQRYDVVLVDAPPLLDTMSAALPLLSLVDGVIFVVKSGQASVDVINRAIDSIKESKANIIGAILNQVKQNTETYYYHYR